MPRLVDALKHEKLRGQVAYILGQMGPAAVPATPALAKLIADKDERVALEAAVGPGEHRPRRQRRRPGLVEASGSQEPEFLRPGLRLGKIGPDAVAAEPALTGLLKSSDRKLRVGERWCGAIGLPPRKLPKRWFPC